MTPTVSEATAAAQYDLNGSYCCVPLWIMTLGSINGTKVRIIISRVQIIVYLDGVLTPPKHSELCIYIGLNCNLQRVINYIPRSNQSRAWTVRCFSPFVSFFSALPERHIVPSMGP